MTKRTAAIYARYSSDIQNDRSVDDQFADCRKFADREKIAIAEMHSDRAKSGASLFDRDGLLELMQRAKARRFNTVIVESLDRLSRDQEDLAGIYKRLKFYGVEILTLNEGTTTSIHVGIRGLVGSLFLADLGAKVRRGATGRVRDGKIPGAVAYGYSRVLGKPGECKIDPVQAEIVRRIFREYAAGRSPRAIALDLTRDGIASPNGGAWNHQTFLSNKYKTGLLSNPIYIGKLQWNKTRTVRNPDTGKRSKRPAEAHELVIADVPHLRIIDQRLWDTAAAVQRSRSDVVMRGRVVGRPMLPRCEHLLAGLTRCGVCGGVMRVNGKCRGKVRIGCASALNHGKCTHTRTYELARLQAGVLDQLRQQIADPRAIAEAAREVHAEWSALQKHHRAKRAAAARNLATVEAKILRLVNALEAGSMPESTLIPRLQELERERVGLTEQVRLVGAETNVVDVHPGLLDAYRANVEKLHAALIANPNTVENRTAFRMLVDSLIVHPTPKRAAYEFTTNGRLGAIMGVDLFPTARNAREILAEHGVTCCDSGNAGKPGLPVSQQQMTVISLGRWRERVAA